MKRYLLRWLLLLALVGIGAGAATAFAADPPPKSGQGDYVPFAPDQQEQVPAPLFVVIAYSAIWLAVVAFVVSVWERQRRVQDEIADLRRQLGPTTGEGGAR